MTSQQFGSAAGAQDPNDLTLPLYGATPKQAITRFLKNYAGFSGRASRSEYWWVSGILAVALLPGYIFYALGFASIDSSGGGGGGGLLVVGIIWIALIALATLVPSLALAWRRLHDAGFPGTLYLISLVPYVGSLVILVLTIMPSKPEGAKYDAVKP